MAHLEVQFGHRGGKSWPVGERRAGFGGGLPCLTTSGGGASRKAAPRASR